MRRIFLFTRAPIVCSAFLAFTIGFSVPTYAQTCTASFGLSHIVQVEGSLHDIRFDEDCNFIYATNSEFNRLEVFDLSSLRVQSPISVGSEPRGFDFNPAGSLAYVANSGGNNISVVNLRNRAESLKVDVEAGFSNDRPFSVAVTRTGLVLFTTTFEGSGFGGRMMQLDPARFNAVSARSDYGPTTEVTYIQASGDRSAVGVAVGNSSGGTVAKYTSASDSFRFNDLSGFLGFIALDRTGDVALVGPSGLVLDENFNQEGQIADSRSKGVAVTPDSDIGYQVAGSVIEILDLKAFLKTGTIEIGDTTSNANGRLAISGDGSLLAVITDNGFSLVRAKGEPIIPNRQFVAFSSAQTQMQSFIRLFNGDTEESTFNVALADLDTGEVVVNWTSPIIEPRASVQIPVTTIEEEGGAGADTPANYLVTVESEVSGAVSHVVWRPDEGILANLSTCDDKPRSISPQTGKAKRLLNVHSSLVDDGYPSTIAIINTGDMETSVRLIVMDARDGIELGRHSISSIPAGSGPLLHVSALEEAMRLTPEPGQFHYNVEIDGGFSGYLQHLVQNRQVGSLSDMTNVCVLKKLSHYDTDLARF